MDEGGPWAPYSVPTCSDYGRRPCGCPLAGEAHAAQPWRAIGDRWGASQSDGLDPDEVIRVAARRRRRERAHGKGSCGHPVVARVGRAAQRR